MAASPQYTIDVLADGAPSVSFKRPGRDTSVSPIEEVFVEANAEDDYGVRNLELGVLGERRTGEGREAVRRAGKRLPEVTRATRSISKSSASSRATRCRTSRARRTTMRSAVRKKASSDIYFLRIRPFKKDFRQAQSQGGGGGGGGGGGNQQVEALSEQQRQIISATHNVQRDRSG